LQFPFRGVLKEQKPLRDWLREILNCCLGYYTFVNGKLYIGIRVNSSVLAGNAFTRAHMLFKSLIASPLQPQFNWLGGQFGDEEFGNPGSGGWQLNTVTIYDIDHASFLGTPDSPQYLTNQMSFVGVSNKSQCARIVTTRLREEIGGLKGGAGPGGPNVPGPPTATLASGGTLVLGQAYYYVITAMVSGTETTQSPEVSATPVTAGTQTINLTWAAVSGASGYRVYRSTTSGSYGASSLVGSPAAASFSDGGAATGAGAPPTLDEQAAARNFQFRTTVLALNTLVGDIISVTDPSMPNGGYVEGRVSRWTLNPDFSIDIQATSTVDDMYDMVVGPKPQDVAAPPVPPETLAAATGLAWMPDEIGPQVGDPIVPQWERTFDLWQEYEISRDGVWLPTVWVKGEMTINQFVSLVQPRITEISLASGGSLNGPMVVYAAITQKDVNGQPAVPSNLTGIYIPQGLNGQQVNLAVVPSGDSNMTAYDVYAGNDRRQMALQFSGTGAPPATVSIPGPIHNMTVGMPEAAAVGVRIAAKHVWHAGIAGLLVNGVTSPNQIQCNDFVGSTDNWIGQIIFVCSNNAGRVPLWNFQVTAFASGTGTLTVTPNCVTGDPTTSVQAGDVLIVYSFATSATATTIVNTMWDNSVNRQQFGSAGMKPGDEVGRIVRILRGTGAGQWRFVTANDATSHTISPPWTTIPDTSSIYIVEAPDWPDVSDTSQLIAPHLGMSIEPHTEVRNLSDEVALIGGFLVDGEGHQTDDAVATYRMIYVFGQPPTVRTVGPGANDPSTSAPWAVAVTDQIIRSDTSANNVTITLPPLDVYQGRGLLVFNIGPNSTVINTTSPDTFPDGTQTTTISTTGGTLRITAGGIYSA